MTVYSTRCKFEIDFAIRMIKVEKQWNLSIKTGRGIGGNIAVRGKSCY